jgi:hypothetical protein
LCTLLGFAPVSPADPNPFAVDFGGGGVSAVAEVVVTTSEAEDVPLFGTPAKAPKSAFDDLNESILAALGGGSPAHAPPPPASAAAAPVLPQHPPPPQQPTSMTFLPPQSAAVAFGSPARPTGDGV